MNIKESAKSVGKGAGWVGLQIVKPYTHAAKSLFGTASRLGAMASDVKATLEQSARQLEHNKQEVIIADDVERFKAVAAREGVSDEAIPGRVRMMCIHQFIYEASAVLCVFGMAGYAGVGLAEMSIFHLVIAALLALSVVFFSIAMLKSAIFRTQLALRRLYSFNEWQARTDVANLCLLPWSKPLPHEKAFGDTK